MGRRRTRSDAMILCAWIHHTTTATIRTMESAQTLRTSTHTRIIRRLRRVLRTLILPNTPTTARHAPIRDARIRRMPICTAATHARIQAALTLRTIIHMRRAAVRRAPSTSLASTHSFTPHAGRLTPTGLRLCCTSGPLTDNLPLRARGSSWVSHKRRRAVRLRRIPLEPPLQPPHLAPRRSALRLVSVCSAMSARGKVAA
mmetsp:Transcript_433/g.1403  ORF Transcript_433/g.1403 Transcript_433/m.1403 type:complete len:201 (+) Transcript_433:919-1521(+)